MLKPADNKFLLQNQQLYARLIFAPTYMDRLKAFWGKVVWSEPTNIKLFDFKGGKVEQMY